VRYPQGCDTRVTLEYEFPGKWVITQMVVHRSDEKFTITSFFVQPETESLEAANRFTLHGRQPVQYAVLVVAVVSMVVMIYALVLCIRTPLERRKWLWIIVILLGAGKLAVDWTTGEISSHIFWVSILPAGMSAQLYGAWTVSVSVPLGALLFLIRRGGLRKKGDPPLPTNVVPPFFPPNLDEPSGGAAA
jgi:hypothetical protein